MKKINILSEQILKLIDFHLKTIDGKINKTLNFYICIEDLKNKTQKYLRVIMYAYSTYRVIAYTICASITQTREVTVFAISSDHDTAWRYQILENIFKNENNQHYNYEGYIDSLELVTSTIEKNLNERLLFLIAEANNSLFAKKHLSIHI